MQLETIMKICGDGGGADEPSLLLNQFNMICLEKKIIQTVLKQNRIYPDKDEDVGKDRPWGDLRVRRFRLKRISDELVTPNSV